MTHLAYYWPSPGFAAVSRETDHPVLTRA